MRLLNFSRTIPPRTGYPRERGTLAILGPHLRVKRFRGLRKVNKKRELFPGRGLMSLRSLTLPSILVQNAGILTSFPFATGDHLDD